VRPSPHAAAPNFLGVLGMMTGSPLSGTGLVADDVYLVAHDDRSGRPLLGPRPLGIALAGGLLAELLLAGCALLEPDGYLLPGQGWPPEPLTARLCGVLVGEAAPRPVRDWLLYAARTATDDVGSRLERAGFVYRAHHRLAPWRSRRVPMDPNWAFAAVVRGARPHDAHGGLLAALAVASGLTFRLTVAASPADQGEVSRLVPPAARNLIPHVEAAVASVVLARRA
jgi:hypothetical protein